MYSNPGDVDDSGDSLLAKRERSCVYLVDGKSISTFVSSDNCHIFARAGLVLESSEWLIQVHLAGGNPQKRAK